MSSSLKNICALVHRRWCLPTLAELHRADVSSTGGSGAGGAKFVTLCHRLDANQGAVRQSLDHLIELGLVRRNPGHGHPLRPEYILTRKGAKLAPCCARVDDVLAAMQLREVCLRRWSLPSLAVVGELSPARFTDIAERLEGVTDRALALSLRGLADSELVARLVADATPVRIEYALGPAGARVSPLLAAMR